MKRLHVNKPEKGSLKRIKMVSSYPINKDCLEYRSRYPLLNDLTDKLNKNLKFYSNEISSSPNPGGTIEEILTNWEGNFDLLERHHGYIQWLFPLRVQGLNYRLHPLQQHEMQAITGNRIMKMRVLRVYKFMLQFYGLSLVDDSSGHLKKLSNFDERLVHLLKHPHNLLRLTRIIRSIGELGWAHLQRPLVELFVDLLLHKSNLLKILKKSMTTSEIDSSMLQFKQSCTIYWVNSILDNTDWEKVKARARPLLH